MIIISRQRSYYIISISLTFKIIKADSPIEGKVWSISIELIQLFSGRIIKGGDYQIVCRWIVTFSLYNDTECNRVKTVTSSSIIRWLCYYCDFKLNCIKLVYQYSQLPCCNACHCDVWMALSYGVIINWAFVYPWTHKSITSLYIIWHFYWCVIKCFSFNINKCRKIC